MAGKRRRKKALTSRRSDSNVSSGSASTTSKVNEKNVDSSSVEKTVAEEAAPRCLDENSVKSASPEIEENHAKPDSYVPEGAAPPVLPEEPTESTSLGKTLEEASPELDHVEKSAVEPAILEETCKEASPELVPVEKSAVEPAILVDICKEESTSPPQVIDETVCLGKTPEIAANHSLAEVETSGSDVPEKASVPLDRNLTESVELEKTPSDDVDVPVIPVGRPGVQKMSGGYMSEDSALPPSPPFEGDADKMESDKPEEKDVSVPSPPSSESGIICPGPDGNESQEDDDEAGKPSAAKRAAPNDAYTNFEESDSPKRLLRSSQGPKKPRCSDYDEQDFDTIRRSILKKSQHRRKKSLGVSSSEKGLERCQLCRQVLVSPNLKFFGSAPENAIVEKEALALPELKVLGNDEVPLNRVVLFSIYDENGHLCRLDDGSVERGVRLHMSGYIKPIFNEDRTSADGGTPAKDIGPITEWWVGGYEEPEPYIGLSTELGEYILGAPSESYYSYLEPIFVKVFLGKLVIEFLNKQEGASYEDLLTYVMTQDRPPGVPPITEDTLMGHAQFICDQVVSFDEAGFSDDESETEDDDWRKLIMEPCLRSLIEFAGATIPSRQDYAEDKKRSIFRNQGPRRKKAETGLENWTKATTTPLVLAVFDSVFADQIDNQLHSKGTGEPEFKERVDDSDSEVDVGLVSPERKGLSLYNYKKVCSKRIEWTSSPVHTSSKETYYSSVLVGDVDVNVGDFVSYSGESCSFIGKVQYMWEDARKEKCAHMLWFLYGKETMLGENADPHEIFMSNRCEAVWLSRVLSRVEVNKKAYSKNWHNEGGLEPSQNSPSSYFYSKMYDGEHCRFEDIPESLSENQEFRYCPNCETTCREFEFGAPATSDPLPNVTKEGKTEFSSVIWKGETFSRGQCVYLDPDTFDFDPVKVSWLEIKYDPDPVDFDNEDLYPERYRKKFDTHRCSNESTPDPFCIGLISSISAKRSGFCRASGITLKVFKFYRPENTSNVVNKGDVAQLDITMLFASEEEIEINFSKVRGKCYVVYEKNLGDADAGKWSVAGPDRFYFQDSYDPVHYLLKEPLDIFRNLGKVDDDHPECDQQGRLGVPEYPAISRKLWCLDLFAGCGGLSDGLHQSGVAEAKWAVEKVSVAAKAFKLNNPQAEVFTMDVNDLLRDVLQGETRNKNGQVYPQKGEVEMIVGGPPCQGYSGLNRFTRNDYSQFKNSLIVSMIAYCDYYRPKYFVMENVRNLVSYAQGSVLKLVFRALLQMGYQVTVGVLQAGHYGVPQTRRRTIVLAAAPGEVLPRYPEARHVFNQQTSHLAIICGDSKFDAGLENIDSAPYRTITVYDAMSDLPSIESGFSKEEMRYDKEPVTHFQRQVREGNTVLRDHICKGLAPIVQTRIDFIPNIRNADWRDLPNFEAEVGDGKKCNILLYTHHDRNYGKSSTGALRGVCSCATGRPCEPTDRQFATLIPWSLPHSAKRNHNWLGLYGRIQWDEYFITTVTNPEPMGKQGKVLHPTQNRVVSVRECARSQGFHDTFKFYGDILEKHRQIGNAVPPPMGKAIGLEIVKSIAQKEGNYVPPFKRHTRALVAEKSEADEVEEPEGSEGSVTDEDNEIEKKVDAILLEDALKEPLRRTLWRECKTEAKYEPCGLPVASSSLPVFSSSLGRLSQLSDVEDVKDVKPHLDLPSELPPILDSDPIEIPDDDLPEELRMPVLSPQVDVVDLCDDVASPVKTSGGRRTNDPTQVDSDSDDDRILVVD